MAEINGSEMYACALMSVSYLPQKCSTVNAYCFYNDFSVIFSYKHICLSRYFKFTVCIFSGAVILKHPPMNTMYRSGLRRNK
jgi:hypothetical protein